MKKEVLALFLAGIMTFTMLAGCGSKSEDTGSTAKSADDSQQQGDRTAA